MVAPNKIAPPDNSHDSDHPTAQRVSPVPGSSAQRSQPELLPDDSRAARPAAPDPISPRQRWAHLLVLDMINANLPLARLAEHLKIPFDTLVAHINTPEVQAEIDAYEQLTNLRARLLGESARPISLRKLLDVLESPAPRPSGRDPDADQRALHRHAELIRRTATTIARESRALAPTSSARTANPSARTTAPRGATGSRRAPSGGEPEPVPSNNTPHRRPPGPAESASQSETEPAPDASNRTASVNERTDTRPSPAPGRDEAPARQSPTAALRAATGSTSTVRDPSRRARDRPAA